MISKDIRDALIATETAKRDRATAAIANDQANGRGATRLDLRRVEDATRMIDHLTMADWTTVEV